MIDGFGGDPEKLSSRLVVSDLLSELPEKIGMQIIAGPFVSQAPETDNWCGIILIAESHCAVHTYPSEGRVCADVFSCKGFNTAVATELIVQAFGITGVTGKILPRGLEYGRPERVIPQSVALSDS